jgi:ABC-type antimicrobial peptide transport system permease subunit
MSHDHYPASLFGALVGSTENTVYSIVACWTVFTELLPGNALIKSFIICNKFTAYDIPRFILTHIIVCLYL